MKGYCCKCKKEIECQEVGGETIYPHRIDLYYKEFWRCPNCGNYTGKYVGEYPVLPSEHIRKCRHEAHMKLNNIWKDRKRRGEYYSYMSSIFKKDFHWGTINNDEEADTALEYTLKFIGNTSK